MFCPLDDPAALPRAYLHGAPPAPDAPPLQGDVDAEVAVVGGGLAGLSAALHLAEAGASVAVLEAREIASGGSGRAFGQVVPYAKHGEPHLLRHFGPEAGGRIAEALGRGPDLVWELIGRHGIACSAVRNGLLFAAHTDAAKAGLAARAAFWQARGAPVEMLDGAETARLIGSRRYNAALLDRRGGHLNPLAYARGLAAAAQRAGARLHAHSRATALMREGAAGWRLRTARGSLRARSVVVCGGAYSDDLWPGLRRTIIPLRAHQLVTAPLSDNLRRSILPEGQSLTDTRRLYSGVRVLPDGRLHLSVDGPAFGTRGRAYLGKATARVRELFSQLGEPDWQEAWTGWVDMTGDQYPRLHRLAPDAWAVIGLSGRGIAFATLLGREVAFHLLGRGEAERFMPVTEPRRLAIRPVARPLVEALLGWYRARDRAELGARRA
jgi:glycine/D-amino acid oxidase-like deaminating enzyme